MDKNNKGVAAIIIMLSAILVASISFIVYNETNIKEKVVYKTKEVTRPQTPDEKYTDYIKNITKRKEIKDISLDGVGARYYLGTDNVLYKSACTSDCAVVPPYKHANTPVPTGTKLSVTNVVDAFASYYGNGGLYKLYVIKEDGKLYRVDYDKNYELIEIDLKNIVSVNQTIGEDATDIVFIDIDGKELKNTK